MASFGKILISIGITLIIVGAFILFVNKLDLPFGKLPGDIRIEGETYTCFIPIATSILASILLTLVLNLLIRFMGR